MHILLVADGRSPITRRWVQGLLAMKMQVTLVSTYPCADMPGAEQTVILPVAFGGYSGSQVGNGQPGTQTRSAMRRAVGSLRNVLMNARYSLGPLTLPSYARRFKAVVKNAAPDLVHAMRIPFEGMLAASTPESVPLVVSIWGNDLTLHAQRTSQMRSHTIRTLQRANGLLADAQRDLRLAVQWGYGSEKPALVVPGAGGIDLAEITRLSSGQDTTSAPVPGGVPLVLNPRGFRPGSVRNDIFFEAIPLVLKERPEVFFACAAMAGQREALQYIEQYGLQEHVRLLPYLPQAQLWSLFQRAEVSVSVSAHDGTPNSLLEAMACRCFPIAGDIESLREWITPGVNGLLVEPDNAPALAEAILRALAHPELREKAAEANRRILEERAEVGVVREKIAAFYQRMLPVLEE